MAGEGITSPQLRALTIAVARTSEIAAAPRARTDMQGLMKTAMIVPVPSFGAPEAAA